MNAIAPGALATRLVDEVLAAGPEKVGAAFFEKNKSWKEKGAVPLELGARLAVYLASAESDGITGKLISAQWDPWEKLARIQERLEQRHLYAAPHRAEGPRQKVGRQMKARMNTDEHGFAACKVNAEARRTQRNAEKQTIIPGLCAPLRSLRFFLNWFFIRVHPWL